ncbi:MAG TPA: hypothetical protein VLX28_00470, partial [Thermoanaerobaculia bacterium]|nr:hypothetical protein [Thermoanaerobaculia bacterium]
AVITGGAWYNLTFGGISEKFLGTAMRLTYWMFLAFSLSMTLLVILLCYLTPWPLRVVLVAVYGGLYIASILYDNVDGLKIGLDTTMLRFSRASLNYYQKHGLLTRDETLSETSAPPDQTALFGHYLAMIENNLKQLEEPRDLEVANHLIASSLDQLFKISEFLLPGEKMVDRGGEYESFVKTAYSMPQEEVDQRTIFYLELIIKTLRARLRGRAAVELDAAESTLEEFKRIRAGASVGEGQASAYQPGIPQSLADHLFIQVFHQLVSLIKAHRSLFFRN